MKIKVLSRSEDAFTRETPREIQKIQRNLDSNRHPFQKAKEYTRALNAVKLDKMFAKPFIGAMEGHKDSVWCMMPHPKSVSSIISAGADGEVIVWSVPFQKDIQRRKCHDSIVRGLCVPGKTPEGFLTCGADKMIKYWNFDQMDVENPTTIDARGKDEEDEEAGEPVSVWTGKHGFTGMDNQRDATKFATSGVGVDLWDLNSTSPVYHYDWGTDTVQFVRFSPIEKDIFATSATDCSLMLYDIRSKTPIRKVVLYMKSNALAWNPMQAYYFTVANEDQNLYTFDMRKLNKMWDIHKDHVSAVLDVAYSPTGREFCSGSYDKTIRIFDCASPSNSREVYYTPRMQKVYVVRYSQDSKYIFSGSDDTVVRIWKTNASEPLGVIPDRQKQALDYNNKLKEKFKDSVEIKRIAKHRHVPLSIYNSKKRKDIMEKAEARKEKNRKRHAKPGSIPEEPEKKARVRAVME